LVRPGEGYSGKTRFDVADLSEVNEALGVIEAPQGQYIIRMRFDPTFPLGAKGFKTRFLSETVLSNAVVLTIN
jgi:hypothetical protein